MAVPEGFWSQMAPAMQRAYEAMDRLEAGQIANPDENRMVGHYWLRAPRLAPTNEISGQITTANREVLAFAKAVHEGQIRPPMTPRFTDLLLIGIGGSALGPQLVADALGRKRNKLRIHFLDNTDPDGISRTVGSLGRRLRSTMVVVISKSGGTSETRNGMIEAQAAFTAMGLDFAAQAVAITGSGSQLDQVAKRDRWLRRFPMWDWVGGRTSVMSAVGLVPAALQGVDVQAFLHGAAEMDRLTRQDDIAKNPAARLALMWHLATGGAGGKDMVVLPYKDRLHLLARYLQQLVMESLGKELNLDGNRVNQGIAVYGNKGSTDQHAYVQQLRDGLENFFVTFIVVLRDLPLGQKTAPVEVEDATPGGPGGSRGVGGTGFTSGDYLSGFWQGTREALFANGRGSITITVDKLDAAALGGLIALYERAVGFYASLVNVNAYHQPGVEAGKKAAPAVLEIQSRAVTFLRDHPDQQLGPQSLAEQIGQPDQVETIYHVLEHLSANRRHVKRRRDRYQYLPPKAD